MLKRVKLKSPGSLTSTTLGKVINWEGCEGQQYGGTYMGVGRGKSEEVVYDPVTGVMLNGNLWITKWPQLWISDLWTRFSLKQAWVMGPYGAIGIGEDVATVVPALIIAGSL